MELEFESTSEENMEEHDVEEVFGKMLEMKHKMFDDARKNIHKAQERYKKDFDKKRNKSEIFNMHEVDCIIMCIYLIFFLN